MKILQVHNFYQQTGGEDLVADDEARLLEAHGHDVVRYTAHNDTVTAYSAVGLARRTIWNQQAYRELRQTIGRNRPQLVHVHNTLPLLSPSVYYGAHAEGLPVVQTLHNFRLVCPAAVCFRDGHVCTDCVGKPVAWNAVRHACYRGSRSASAAVVTMLSVHRLLGTWRDRVGLYVALTAQAERMFTQAGVPAAKIVVKPHFVDPDPGAGTGLGGHAIFVGRLSHEKGIDTLLQAWRLVNGLVPLVVIGDGPLAPAVAAAAREIPGITWLGRRDSNETLQRVRDAACLVFPSECYETFGRAIIEAFAAATPVVAAGHGAAAELVADGVTGLHFHPGNASDLAGKIRRLHGDGPLRIRMRAAARQEFETRYTAEVNYRLLLDLYRRAAGGTPLP